MWRLCCLTLFTLSTLAHDVWILAPGPEPMLRVVNGQLFRQDVEVTYFDALGTALDTIVLSLESHQATWLAAAAELSPHSIRIRSTAAIAASVAVKQGDTLDIHMPQTALSIPLTIPHIAENTTFWETRADLLVASGQAPIRARTLQGESLIPTGPSGSSLSIDLESLFTAGIPEGHGWGSLRAKGTQLAALVTFHDRFLKQGASLPLPFHRSNILILPHVPSDRATWWSGLALVNTNQELLRIKASGYVAGSVEAIRAIGIPANSKRVGLLDDLVSEPWPENLDWILFESDLPLVGFELFGTQNGETLTGLPMGNKLNKRVAFTQSAAKDWWSGLAMLNPGNLPIDINMIIRSDDGSTFKTDNFKLMGYEKKSLVLETTYGLNSDQYWIELQSTHGFIAFQLMGDIQQKMLGTFAATPLKTDDINLSIPTPSVDLAENLSQVPQATADIDSDGDDELIILSEQDLAIIDWSPAPQLKLSSHETFEYVNDTGVPAYLYVKDLDNDGHFEVIVTTRDMTLATLDDTFVPSRLQPYRPDVADDPIIRDFADVNLDGMLDILTNRRLFKSQLGLTNFYYWNTFPFMFDTTGRGSLFMTLNGDIFPDILTVLFDSFYAILVDQLDENPSPIYTPQQFRDVIAIYKADLDQDGSLETMSLIADSVVSTSADAMDITRFRIDGADTLVQFDIPLSWGFNQFVQVERPDKPVMFGQEIGNMTRYWAIDLTTGPYVHESRAWRGMDADVNGDGLLDLVAANGVLLSEPHGRQDDVALPFILKQTSTEQIIPFVDDFDLDQQMEVLTLRRSGTSSFYTVDYWEYSGDGRSWESERLLTLNTTGLSFADLRDMDGDGDLDFVVGGFGLKYYEQTETGFSDIHRFVHTPDKFSVGPARRLEINGNQYEDLLAEHISGSKQILIVQDAYGPDPHVQLLNLYVSINELEVLDIDGDGDMDIKVDSPSRGREMWLQEGNSWIKKTFNFNIDTYEFIDLTGNGELDLIAYVTSPDKTVQYLRFLKNRGDLTFSNIYTLQLPPDTRYTKIVTLDVNQDGRRDILALGATETTTTQYLDIWENRFTTEVTEVPVARLQRLEWRNEPNRFVLNDFDFDGLQDLQFWVDYHFLWYRARTSYHPKRDVNPYRWPLD